ELGPHLHHGIEGHRAGVGPGCDFDLGVSDDVHGLVPDSQLVPVGDVVVDGLVAYGRLPDPGLEDGTGHLALAEPRHSQLSGQLFEGLVDRLVDLGHVDFHRELDLVALQLGHFRFHMNCGAYLAPAASIPCGLGSEAWRARWPRLTPTPPASWCRPSSKCLLRPGTG